MVTRYDVECCFSGEDCNGAVASLSGYYIKFIDYDNLLTQHKLLLAAYQLNRDCFSYQDDIIKDCPALRGKQTEEDFDDFWKDSK